VNTSGVLHFIAMVITFACSVKYEHEEMVEH